MISFEEHIANINERVAQEERRRIRDRNREKERLRKIDTSRQIIIGGIMTKHFPDMLRLHPQLKRADTDIEFARLEEFVSVIANDPKCTALFQELVVGKIVGRSHQK